LAIFAVAGLHLLVPLDIFETRIFLKPRYPDKSIATVDINTVGHNFGFALRQFVASQRHNQNTRVSHRNASRSTARRAIYGNRAKLRTTR